MALVKATWPTHVKVLGTVLEPPLAAIFNTFQSYGCLIGPEKHFLWHLGLLRGRLGASFKPSSIPSHTCMASYRFSQEQPKHFLWPWDFENSTMAPEKHFLWHSGISGRYVRFLCKPPLANLQTCMASNRFPRE